MDLPSRVEGGRVDGGGGEIIVVVSEGWSEMEEWKWKWRETKSGVVGKDYNYGRKGGGMKGEKVDEGKE